MKTDAYKFLSREFDLTVWSTVRPNPRFEDMLAAAELYKSAGCDYIIGAGGGSVLDSAKMIKLLITNNPKTALTQPMEDNDIGFLRFPPLRALGRRQLGIRYSM